MADMADTNSLQLGKILIKNYKVYRGVVTVDLSLEQDKPVTVIHGEMGKGKTTLLGAIYWCLYGEERSIADSDENVLNNDVLSQLEVGSDGETSVEISLYEQGELRYKIRRSIQFNKRSESAESRMHRAVGGSLPTGIDISESVEYSELPPRSENWEVLQNTPRIRDKIENLFPKSLSSYFLFDAELLDKFFRADDETLVKDGIEKISGLPIIDNAIKHLDNSAKVIRKDIKQVNLEPIENKILYWERAQNESKKTIGETDPHLKKLDTEIAGLEFYLRNNNEKSVESAQKEFDAISKNITKIIEKRGENQQKINNWILSHSVALQLKGVLEDSIKQCDAWETEGKIPIAVSRYTLDGMLRANPPACICGAPLDEGSAGRRHIEDLLGKNLAESPVIQNISIGRGHWGDLVDGIGQTRDELARLRAERDSLNTEYDEQDSSRRNCSKTLEMHNVEEIRDKSQLLRELREKVRVLNGVRALAVDKLERAGRELAKLNQEYDKLLKRDKKHASQSNRLELAKTLSDLLDRCRNDLIEELRSTVAKKTEKYFLKLVSRDDFVRIEIRPDYKTSVIGSDGKRKSLSAGQSCCLALSYIASIRDIAEKNYFMMIDSPLHNISQAERVDIAQNLPQFIPGTQITLLVQDQEYTGSAKEGIVGGDIPSVRRTLIDNKRLWREYILVTGKNRGDVSASTHIRPVVIP